MKVEFFEGLAAQSDGETSRTFWAKTPEGTWRIPESGEGQLTDFDASQALSERLLAEVDLEGLDRSGVEFIVFSILEGGYLDKPGVRHRAEAVLYVLVNEALHRMDRIKAKCASLLNE